jgi:hypothetical protein
MAVLLAFTGSFLISVTVLFIALAAPHGVSDGVLVASLGLFVIGVLLAFAIWLVEYAKSK